MPEDNQPDINDRLLDAQLRQVLAMLTHEISEEQQHQVRDRLKHSLELAEKVRTTPMANGDEPEIVFQPYRRPER